MTTIADRPPQSRRTVARCGLRMMPTFPLSPLSFRTAGFPQYGWKAGISDSAFPEHHSLKPAPGIRRCTPGLRLPFAHLIVRFGCPGLCRADDFSMRRLGVGVRLRPRGSRSSPGSSVPVHQHLVDAHVTDLSLVYAVACSRSGVPFVTPRYDRPSTEWTVMSARWQKQQKISFCRALHGRC